MEKMSKTIKKSKLDFFTSTQFISGLMIGLSLFLLMAIFLSLPAIIDRNMNEISIEDCSYGLHHDFFGTRCVYHSEMQEIIGCEEFYLRDGYWWECIDTEYNTNNYDQTFEGSATIDYDEWDCPETNQYGTIQECITYWNSLSDLAENEGRYAMLKKLNSDDYLSDTVKQFIFEIEGIWLFDKDI